MGLCVREQVCLTRPLPSRDSQGGGLSVFGRLQCSGWKETLTPGLEMSGELLQASLAATAF